jgi:hypothetical protein
MANGHLFSIMSDFPLFIVLVPFFNNIFKMGLATKFAIFLLLLFVSNDNAIFGMFPGDYVWDKTPAGQAFRSKEIDGSERARNGLSGTPEEEGEGGLLGWFGSFLTGGEDTTASSSNSHVIFFSDQFLFVPPESQT